MYEKKILRKNPHVCDTCDRCTWMHPPVWSTLAVVYTGIVRASQIAPYSTMQLHAFLKMQQEKF